MPLVFVTELGNGAAIAEPAPRPKQPGRRETPVREKLSDDAAGDAARSFRLLLEGGNDGERPGFSEYEGDSGDTDGRKSGLRSLEDIEDISMVAAPGSTFGYSGTYKSDADAITRLLDLPRGTDALPHRRPRRAQRAGRLGDPGVQGQARLHPRRPVLPVGRDPRPGDRSKRSTCRRAASSPGSMRATTSTAASTRRRPTRWSAPRSASRSSSTRAQQEVLNPEGVNCFRFFAGRGIRLWGARTISSDPEWKYVNLRRYFAYLEHSIDKGTQWAVFENNTPSRCGQTCRGPFEDFLFNEWKYRRAAWATSRRRRSSSAATARR